MATILDKDLIRETTLKHNEREIVVTIGADQKFHFKLKGMKSGVVSIGIDEVYKQLIGETANNSGGLLSEAIADGNAVIEEQSIFAKKQAKSHENKMAEVSKDNPMVPLYELRTKAAVSVMPVETHVLFEGIILDCIKTIQKPFIDKELEIKKSKK
jgi:hypothetical protein